MKIRLGTFMWILISVFTFELSLYLSASSIVKNPTTTNCYSNRLAWEIEDWQIVFEDEWRVVVSWVWYMSSLDGTGTYFTGERATRKDFCWAIKMSETNRYYKMIYDAKVQSEREWADFDKNIYK